MPVLSAAKPQCMLICSAQPREREVASVRRMAEARILMLSHVVVFTAVDVECWGYSVRVGA